MRWGLFLLLTAFAVAEPASPPPEQTELFALINAQAAAFEREDVTAILATLHRESPLRDATENLIEKIKETYDLHYIVSDLVVVSLGSEEARVSFTQITEKTRGPQFRNNRVQGVHIFKKDDGHWRFFETQVLNVEYLDKGSPPPAVNAP